MRTRATLDPEGAGDQGTGSHLDPLAVADGDPGARLPELRAANPTQPAREAITVVLGRFSSLLGAGLASVLRNDRSVRVIGSDVRDADLEEVIARRCPAVAMLDEQSVTDLSLPARLCSARPSLALVVLARAPSREHCERLLALGARACLPKDASAEELLSVLRLAAAGWHLLAPPGSAPSLAGQARGICALTPREREVLQLLSLGRTDHQIALALHIGAETARSHVRRICRKLGVARRRELLGGLG